MRSPNRKNLLESIRNETRAAIEEIEANPGIARSEKIRLVRRVVQAQQFAERHEEHLREREASLEVMSLLGVVAGFMSHEFGTALDELTRAQQRLILLGKRDAECGKAADALEEHLNTLREFVTYSQGYVFGASARPEHPYPARPRLQQISRIFSKYASERKIDVEITADRELLAPTVPVSLYSGVALNLFTNALKAVIAKTGNGDRRVAFRAWNEQDTHFLEVSDTGIGIPVALRQRVFDPLFTTTASNRDPLGSGMGLGLSLVRRGVGNYGGRVDVIEAPAGFTTCVRIRLPLSDKGR